MKPAHTKRNTCLRLRVSTDLNRRTQWECGHAAEQDSIPKALPEHHSGDSATCRPEFHDCSFAIKKNCYPRRLRTGCGEKRIPVDSIRNGFYGWKPNAGLSVETHQAPLASFRPHQSE